MGLDLLDPVTAERATWDKDVQDVDDCRNSPCRSTDVFSDNRYRWCVISVYFAISYFTWLKMYAAELDLTLYRTHLLTICAESSFAPTLIDVVNIDRSNSKTKIADLLSRTC